jgi:nucleotide-binding universal stress UspA family protein
MILIAYDGSADAQAAIESAGALMPSSPATVLIVWEQFEDLVSRVGAGMPVGDVDYEGLDRSYHEQARQRAEQGAELARAAGLKAEPRVCIRSGSVAESILAEADEVGADAIVLGTRGLTGLKSLFMGSVSHAVLQNSDRPVVVVPSPEVAASRAAHRGQRPPATTAE